MKKRISIIFGGNSTEHEVSLASASNIFNAVDRDIFDVILIGIDKTGKWCFNPEYNSSKIDLKEIDYFQNSTPILLENKDGKTILRDKGNCTTIDSFDIAFPIIHGAFGEDGVIQGIFKSLDIPFIGADILGSAVCMDKDVTKRLLRDSKIPIAKFITIFKEDRKKYTFELVKEKLGIPLFIKPCNAGSSVGVSKVIDKISFHFAIENAYRYDKKKLMEEAISGKEMECAIFGNEKPKASVIGEIIPTKEFYTYDAKYNDSDGARITVPAQITDEISETLREYAIKAYKTTCCEGMARVDFFVRDNNSFVVNEINTIPGFTDISMYPKLWIESGISYSDLITKLVTLGFDKFEKNRELETIR